MMKDENYWEIQDDNGVIHSGSESEMKMAFDIMCDQDVELLIDSWGLTRKKVITLIKEYCVDWEGDLKLIEVHNIYR